MGDRIAVMRDGILQQVDTPQTLYNQPANMFVAGFIGSPAMNFFEAQVRVSGEETAIDAGAFRLQAPPSRAVALRPYDGQSILFGVRPEHIADRNLSMAPALPGNSITAIVEVTEPMGDRVYLSLAAAPHTLIASVDPETRAQEDQPLDLVIDMEKTHAFDRNTETAIY